MTGPIEEPTPEAPAAPALQRLKFLMRSGNAFMVDGVVDWDIEGDRAGRITSLQLEQSKDPRYARVVVETIDLAQIEAVVLLPKDSGRADRS